MKYESVKQMKTLLEDNRGASGIDQIEAELALGVVLSFLSAPFIADYGTYSRRTPGKRFSKGTWQCT